MIIVISKKFNMQNEIFDSINVKNISKEKVTKQKIFTQK